MKMAILVACEYSAVVRDEFRKRGHLAISCDLRPTDGDPDWHYRGDVRDALAMMDWDMVIAFPPCTDLSAAGARYWAEKRADGRQLAAVAFVRAIADAPAPRIVIENPQGALTAMWRKPDQVIEPYQFGEPWRKRTCLWLKGVPPLEPTRVVRPRGSWVCGNKIRQRPGTMPGRRGEKIRARTFRGIARAMAEQWG